jgi:hypothetical protein
MQARHSIITPLLIAGLFCLVIRTSAENEVGGFISAASSVNGIVSTITKPILATLPGSQSLSAVSGNEAGSVGDVLVTAFATSISNLVFTGNIRASLGENVASTANTEAYGQWFLDQTVTLRFQGVTEITKPIYLEGAFTVAPTLTLDSDRYATRSTFGMSILAPNGDPLTPSANASKTILTTINNDGHWHPVVSDAIPGDHILRFRKAVTVVELPNRTYEGQVTFRVSIAVVAQLNSGTTGSAPTQHSVVDLGKVAFQKPRLVDGDGNSVAFGAVLTQDGIDVSQGSEPGPSLQAALYAGLKITGVVGETYRVEYRTDLSTENWTNLAEFPLTASPFFYVDAEGIDASAKRFYRVIKP